MNSHEQEIKDRMKIVILSMSNDGLEHHQDAIIKTVAELDWNNLSDEEYEILSTVKGHGGKSVDGKCSVCLDILNTIEGGNQ